MKVLLFCGGNFSLIYLFIFFIFGGGEELPWDILAERKSKQKSVFGENNMKKPDWLVSVVGGTTDLHQKKTLPPKKNWNVQEVKVLLNLSVSHLFHAPGSIQTPSSTPLYVPCKYMTRPCHLDTSPRVFVIWISRDWTPRSNCDQFPHIYHVSQSIMSARIGLDLWHVPQQLHDFQNSILISSGKFWIHRSMQCYQVRSLRVYTPHKNTHYPRYIKVVCFVRKSDKTRGFRIWRNAHEYEAAGPKCNGLWETDYEISYGFFSLYLPLSLQ